MIFFPLEQAHVKAARMGHGGESTGITRSTTKLDSLRDAGPRTTTFDATSHSLNKVLAFARMMDTGQKGQHPG